MDISYDNGSGNFGTDFPSKKSFIEEVLPKLNLNFHNPELNGLVKQNGALEFTNGVKTLMHFDFRVKRAQICFSCILDW
jgi:hypothetical protein